METINGLRQEIDQVHQELHSLLLRRRDLTMAIWKIKQAEGLPFFSPDREEQILADFVKRGGAVSADPPFDELLRGVMQSILREYEKYLKAQYSAKS